MLGLAGAASAVRGVDRARPAVSAGLPLIKVHFEFRVEERATHYTVVNTGNSAGELDLAHASYVWTLKPPENDTACNNDGTLTGIGNEFVWHHGNEGDPISNDHCNHDGDAIGPTGHQGTVSVEVSDAKWTCTASYTGTQRADGNASGDGPDGDCLADTTPQPPPPLQPPPTPPKAACKCARLTAEIVPSTLEEHDESVDNLDLSFTLRWTLTCLRQGSPKNRECKGTLGLGAVSGTTWLTNRRGFLTVDCVAECAAKGKSKRFVTIGMTKLRLSGDLQSLAPAERAGTTESVRVFPVCVGGVKFKPIVLKIVFDHTGQVDLAKSDLDGNGKQDGRKTK